MDAQGEGRLNKEVKKRVPGVFTEFCAKWNVICSKSFLGNP